MRWVMMAAVSAGLLSTLVACGGEEPAAMAEAPAEAAPAEAAPVEAAPAPVEAAPAEAATAQRVVRLESLEAGDTSCLAMVDDGGMVGLHADFGLCAGGDADASALIGKSVRVTTKKGKVMAESCQGNPDCTDSEEVDLVIKIEAAEG
jgi:hypothetical protein